MKNKIIIYIDNQGRISVDVPPSMDLPQCIGVFAAATKIVYDVIVEEEARKRAIEKSEMDELVRILLKQKNPKLN